MATLAALVTLEQAKRHLRVVVNTYDDDIELKAEQASAIILDYLKGRAHEALSTASITSSSVASPTVITTVSPHGLTTGTVFISGHVDSVPSINGLRVISAGAGSTFTIPIAVTTAGTGGTVSLIWTADTVPQPVQAATLLMLGHLHEHRGDDMKPDADLWQAIERLLVRFRDPALA